CSGVIAAWWQFCPGAAWTCAAGLRIVHVTHTSPVIHVLDPIDVAAVVGHAFGAQDAATGLALDAADRVGQRTTMLLARYTLNANLRPAHDFRRTCCLWCPLRHGCSHAWASHDQCGDKSGEQTAVLERMHGVILADCEATFKNRKSRRSNSTSAPMKSRQILDF